MAGQRLWALAFLPDVGFGGQGGLGDIAVHPGFANNGFIYLSHAEGGIGGTRGGCSALTYLSC